MTSVLVYGEKGEEGEEEVVDDIAEIALGMEVDEDSDGEVEENCDRDMVSSRPSLDIESMFFRFDSPFSGKSKQDSLSAIFSFGSKGLARTTTRTLSTTVAILVLAL